MLVISQTEEHNSAKAEYRQDGTTMSELDRYQAHRKAEHGLSKIRQAITRLCANAIPPDKLEESGDKIVNTISSIVNDHTELNEVILSASGSDVLIPNIQPSMQEDRSSFTFSINTERPFTQVSNLSPIAGMLENISIAGPKEIDGKYYFGANMFLKVKQVPLRVPLNDMPFMRIERTDFAQVSLSNNADTNIVVRQLEILREQKEAFAALGKSGLQQSIYAKKVRSLGQAFAQEESKFKELKNISILHTIGKLGKQHADVLNWRSDRVTDPLAKVIGKGRFLQVESDTLVTRDEDGDLCYYPGKYSGNLVDVCTDLDGFDGHALLAVLYDGSSDGNFTYVPLDRIDKLWF